MNIIGLFIILIGIVLVSISFIKTNCPPPRIIYREVPMHNIDLQFSEQNFPSNVHKDLFYTNPVIVTK